ncbi:MAG: isoprenylcysteine carboxylmethyltransferase family protein [Anaerolineae bacterium]|nr:isoprenylcysteine carboxylmethyltransferase family protein [Anaerolineae bacterium]MCB0200701.1 isoprenylcysteine carboxylmethyltransferase family protein [Anaerolineae bacterium]MCB0254649.1 isoprenylcysteine carboxylmethyltransferase family protein [Anaerolineae bacterium]
MKSIVFVAIQFICLGIIALTGPLIARQPLWLAVELTGAALALWTLWTWRLGRFNVLPDVLAGARLVTSGPYRFIRHPMYAALLLGSLGLVGNAPTPLRVGTWVVLLTDFILKLSYEEQLLAARFPEYTAYQQTSKRLIPLVY